jgi:hypothetical protein
MKAQKHIISDLKRLVIHGRADALNDARAFVAKDGRVRAHGNPAMLDDDVLASVRNESWVDGLEELGGCGRTQGGEGAPTV